MAGRAKKVVEEKRRRAEFALIASTSERWYWIPDDKEGFVPAKVLKENPDGSMEVEFGVARTVKVVKQTELGPPIIRLAEIKNHVDGENSCWRCSTLAKGTHAVTRLCRVVPALNIDEVAGYYWCRRSCLPRRWSLTASAACCSAHWMSRRAVSSSRAAPSAVLQSACAAGIRKLRLRTSSCLSAFCKLSLTASEPRELQLRELGSATPCCSAQQRCKSRVRASCSHSHPRYRCPHFAVYRFPSPYPMSLYADMVRMGDVNEATILHNLRMRFAEDLIYTNIGSILVSRGLRATRDTGSPRLCLCLCLQPLNLPCGLLLFCLVASSPPHFLLVSSCRHFTCFPVSLSPSALLLLDLPRLLALACRCPSTLSASSPASTTSRSCTST